MSQASLHPRQAGKAQLTSETLEHTHDRNPTLSRSTSPSMAVETSARKDGSGQVSYRNSSRGYLFSPLVDCLFIANVLWPLLWFVDWAGGLEAHEGILFWQIFFVTAPHRWITIAVVSVDHHRSDDRRWLFASLAVVILAVCLCIQFGTGSLLCLGVVDYAWNAWHFSSQHHGVFRIYQRNGLVQESTWKGRLHKIAFRVFLLYVIARVAGLGWNDFAEPINESLATHVGASGPFVVADILLMLIPIYLVALEWTRWGIGKTAKIASVVYLTSVMGLFASMLLAAHFQRSQSVIQLAVASAIFHSVEYLSIVTWSVRKSVASPQSNVLKRLSETWFLFLFVFVAVIGVGNYLLSQGLFQFWVTVNLIVAFWHYCFDGMIWKRRPNSSKGSPITSAP
ncbi:hypothetical protein Poly59_50480 [Rubripirellula reticaptiva]|uniref:Transmembrane protein n=1 Tax=Rubripirellula reticaptiva TaxID=2528013 RepID=A0A5C6EGS6_9BACT|nr:hypothetical protein Poly59_50480 [Rubripirellula reticaptiva]